MIKLCILLGVILLAGNTMADRWMWDANPEPVDGYKIYCGTSSRDYATPVDVGKVTEYGIEELDFIINTTYYCCATAYNTTGESDFSNEAMYRMGALEMPEVPEGLKITSVLGGVLVNNQATVVASKADNMSVEKSLSVLASVYVKDIPTKSGNVIKTAKLKKDFKGFITKYSKSYKGEDILGIEYDDDLPNGIALVETTSGTFHTDEIKYVLLAAKE